MRSALLYSAIGLLVVATIFAISILLLIYGHRRKSVQDAHAYVPEDLAIQLQNTNANLGSFATAHNALMHYLKASVEKVSGTADKTGEKIDALMQAYLTLQGALDQKDTELKRLREGYDAHLYRRFIARFLRARHAIIDAKAHQRFDQQAFLQVEQLLDDALDDCGVESFAPEIGSDYRTANGVADPPAKTPTDTEDNAFKIAEVLELGYRLNSNGHREVIVPARVRIFVR